MDGKNIKVLLIEDNPLDARLIREMVAEVQARAAGESLFEIEWMGSLATGLAYLEREDVEVIILDLALPDSRGIDTFSKIYAQAPRIPIVLLTGVDDEDLAIQVVRRGAQDYLVKGLVEGHLIVRSMRYAIERKRAEEEIRKFKTIADKANYGVIISELSGKITYVNQNFAEVHGYEIAEILGNDLSIFYNDEQLKRVEELTRKLYTEGSFSAQELWHRHKDGTEFPMLVNGIIVRSEQDKPLFIAATMIDITEMKRTEDELRKLSRAVEQSPSSVMITDVKGDIEYVNPKFTEVTGYTFEEVRGENPRILKSGEMEPEGYEKLWETIAAGGEWRGVFHNRKKDGGLFWESAAISPIRSAKGEITHFLAVKEDITERKELEQRLLRSQKLAAIGKLTASVAHEINNPLQAIIGLLDLAKDEIEAGSEVSEYLDITMTEVRRIARIVERMRDLSRERGKEKEEIDVNILLSQVLELTRKKCEHNGVEVLIDLTLDLPALRVIPDQIEQVFLNLVINAIEAMSTGGCLRLSTMYDEQHSRVIVEVADTGGGIKPNILPRIFEPFFSTKADSMGMGLSLSHSIVERHDGRIEVDTKLDEGTTFTVILPA